MTRPTPPARRLDRIIAADPLLADFEARRRREAALTASVRAALPRPLASLATASVLPEGRLDVVVPTGTVAAAVRIRLPAVATALAREGWDFKELRVRVQPGGHARPQEKPLPLQRDTSSAAALGPLEARLAPGPLRDAVTRLRRRLGG